MFKKYIYKICIKYRRVCVIVTKTLHQGHVHANLDWLLVVQVCVYLIANFVIVISKKITQEKNKVPS